MGPKCQQIDENVTDWVQFSAKNNIVNIAEKSGPCYYESKLPLALSSLLIKCRIGFIVCIIYMSLIKFFREHTIYG